MSEGVFNLLRQSPLLEGLGAGLIQELADSGRILTLKGRHRKLGDIELSRRLYVVLSGEMRMMRVGPDGQELLMQRLYPGEFFCLASVVSRGRCNSLMVNAGKTDLLYWGHETFRLLMQKNPDLHHEVLNQMAFEIEQEREMRTLSRCCKADLRVAAYLLNRMKNCRSAQAIKYSLDVRPVSLTAQELGLARETLSRSLQRLVKRDAINYDRGMIQVRDITSLEAVLEDMECDCHCISSQVS